MNKKFELTDWDLPPPQRRVRLNDILKYEDLILEVVSMDGEEIILKGAGVSAPASTNGLNILIQEGVVEIIKKAEEDDIYTSRYAGISRVAIASSETDSKD